MSDYTHLGGSYNAYINSSLWRNRRKAYAASHPQECYVCGQTETCHLHHKSYARVGAEPDDDLAWVCRRHHDLLHRLVDEDGVPMATVLDYLKDGWRQAPPWEIILLEPRHHDGKPVKHSRKHSRKHKKLPKAPREMTIEKLRGLPQNVKRRQEKHRRQKAPRHKSGPRRSTLPVTLDRLPVGAWRNRRVIHVPPA